ncbi:hypothetical protein GC163_12160 [bacterium]|nr:hypothetical protein [bacterium]
MNAESKILPPSSQNTALVYLLHPQEVLAESTAHNAACFEQIHEWLSHQSSNSHQFVQDPINAEFVLAPIQGGAYGPFLERLRNSSIFRRMARKVLVYSPDDNQFPAVRGLYTSVSHKLSASSWALPAHYISSHIHRFHFQREELNTKDVLFSFVGSSNTHPIRQEILQLRHAAAILRDSTPKSMGTKYWWQEPNAEDFFIDFREITRRSQFAICPRGISPASIRLFEVMEAGCVPVVVSDGYIFPHGPEWPEFTIHVPEREVATIPERIVQAEPRAKEMGAAARQAWETYFSPASTVNSLVTWARTILLQSNSAPPVTLKAEEYLRPRNLLAKLRFRMKG